MPLFLFNPLTLDEVTMAKGKTPDFRQQIRQLRDLLAKRLDHHLIAYKSLLSGDGTPVLSTYFSKQAADEWSKAFAENKKDWVACHHLAVMYHSQAFELEAMGQTEEARPYWAKASFYWRELVALGEPFAIIKSAFSDSLEIDHIGKLLEEIGPLLPFNFLLIHHRLYQEYLAHGDEERAEIHFGLIENSVFPEASQVLEDAYIQKFGRQVLSLNNECIGLTEKKLLARASATRALAGSIGQILKNRPTFTAALSDYCILQALMVRISVQEWDDAALKRYNDSAQLRDEYDTLVSELQDINRRVEASGGFNTSVDHVNYLKKFRRYEEIQEKINQVARKSAAEISAIKSALRECYRHFNNLTAQRSAVSVDLLEAVRSAIRSIEKVASRGFSNEEEYLALSKVADEFRPLMRIEQDKLISSSPKRPIAEQSLWRWTDLKPGLHPYARTIFMLTATEMPVLTNTLSIKELIKNIKLNIMQKSLLRKANAGRHLVFGRRVEATDLNAVQAVLDRADHSAAEAIELAKHMLLQHQAHTTECNDILSSLEAMDWQDFQQEPVKMTMGITALFKGIPLAKRPIRDWRYQDLNKPELPGPVVRWPE
ncbi:MAG TPA: hypothetical protein PKY55_02400 [bacterium]|nr:hypothetical protein [bacterium]